MNECQRLNDTIAAIITPPGVGAMGALRLSGPLAFSAAAAVFVSKSGKTVVEMGDYSLNFGHIYLGGELLDQALLLKMKGPHSFTGEDVAEIQCHGGPVVLSQILQALTELGEIEVRGALPGEFSQRAFFHGKMDLSQAEAVMALVNALSPLAVNAAAGQIDGRLSRQIQALKEKIITVLASIEVTIDFPDEETVVEALKNCPGDNPYAEVIKGILSETEALLAAAQYGRIYRDGLRIVFYGKPNAGKSSLLNRILQEPRAIVTSEPGTTRDVLEERVLLKGIPLLLTDTAGMGQAGSAAEEAGMVRAKAAAAQADLVLYVVDLSIGLTMEDQALLSDLDKSKTLIIYNKLDLAPEMIHHGAPLPTGFDQAQVCLLSALDPGSLEALAEKIKGFFSRQNQWQAKPEVILSQRQEEALLRAAAALRNGAAALQRGLPLDAAVWDLREGWQALGEITGETVQPALVEELFSRFCLGK